MSRPSTLNGAAMDAVIGDIKDEFGSAVYGVQAIADFMNRHGALKSPPRSWKDVVAPRFVEFSEQLTVKTEEIHGRP